jgi:hypothetical protein
MAELGEYKAFILKLAQIHPLRVRVTLPAAPYGRIKPGSRAEVMPEEPTDNHHAATVAGIDKPDDAASGTLPAGPKCWVSLRIVFSNALFSSPWRPKHGPRRM